MTAIMPGIALPAVREQVLSQDQAVRWLVQHNASLTEALVIEGSGKNALVVRGRDWRIFRAQGSDEFILLTPED